jgi:hypothetical protein
MMILYEVPQGSLNSLQRAGISYKECGCEIRSIEDLWPLSIRDPIL